MHISPKGLEDSQPPTETGIRNAVVLAREDVPQWHRKGRLSIDAHEPISTKLGSIFLRYQPAITRITDVGTPGATHPKSAAIFLILSNQFFRLSIRYCASAARVTPLTIVRQATQIYQRQL
jgi:hypothetical protein